MNLNLFEEWPMKNTIKNIALTAALALTSATAGAQSLTGYFMDNIPKDEFVNIAKKIKI